MPIISKETWDKFTQEEKQEVIEVFQMATKNNAQGKVAEIYGGIFPEEALLPQPLTYEDVARELFKVGSYQFIDYGDRTTTFFNEFGDKLYPLNFTSQKQAEKLLAINKLLNVAAFLNKGWKPDWSDRDTSKWSIELDNRDNKLYPKSFLYSNHSIVYFPNIETTEQAIQILGEDTVRLALSSDY